MSSSNARRAEIEAERRRSRRRAADERPVPKNRNDLLPPPPLTASSVPSSKLFPLQQLPPPGGPPLAHQQHPQPLMAERRPAPPGMAINFSGQAYTDTELFAEMPRKKFTGRCRLFVGNLSTEVKEAELKELFTPHGDIAECYLSGKGFAFLRLDTRAHAESAKEALDGKTIHGRQLRVRYAVHGATIKVKEMSPAVSNEMLFLAFSAFGDVERAVHIVDEKGRPTGEGIVEFERKVSAQEAIAQIRERVFLMTANSRPLQADFVDPKDDEDGLSEKMIQRTPKLYKERELGPRFAQMNSFEYIYGRRWKELYEFERKRRAELDAELLEQRRRLDIDMEAEYEDYKAQMLREELQRRQEELDRLEVSRQMRRQQMQQQQLMSGMMWEPQLVDGPLGRNMPPTFGQAGGPGGGSGGGGQVPPLRGIPPMMMMMDNNNNNNNSGLPLRPGGGGHGPPPPLSLAGGMGLGGAAPMGVAVAAQSLLPPHLRGPAGDEDERNATSGRPGSVGLQNGRVPSPQAPDVRKFLQGFRVSPQQPNGRQQQQGPLPPGLASLLDRAPLQQHHQQQMQQPLPNPFGPGFLPQGVVNGSPGGGGPPPPGGRIPPPPPPMGGAGGHMMGPGPALSLLAGGFGDFPPPDKKSRH